VIFVQLYVTFIYKCKENCIVCDATTATITASTSIYSLNLLYTLLEVESAFWFRTYYIHCIIFVYWDIGVSLCL